MSRRYDCEHLAKVCDDAFDLAKRIADDAETNPRDYRILALFAAHAREIAELFKVIKEQAKS